MGRKRRSGEAKKAESPLGVRRFSGRCQLRWLQGHDRRRERSEDEILAKPKFHRTKLLRAAGLGISVSVAFFTTLERFKRSTRF